MIPVKYCIDYEMQSMMDGVDVVVNKYTDFTDGQMHTHTFIEVCCVASGNGWHIHNEHIHRCTPGDLFIVDAGDAHLWIADDDSPMTIYNLIFRPVFFDPALKGKTSFSDMAGCFLLNGFNDPDHFKSLRVHYADDEFDALIALYENMLSEYRRHEAGFSEYIRACATQLMVSIFRKHRISAAAAAPDRRPASSSLTPVFDYINVHFAEDISLNQLAGLVYLSPSYFSRMFKLYTGRTVTEYIQRMRVYNARTQLTATDLPIAAIAEANGYSDPKHFTRIFRRILGISPTEYRAGRRIE